MPLKVGIGNLRCDFAPRLSAIGNQSIVLNVLIDKMLSARLTLDGIKCLEPVTLATKRIVATLTKRGHICRPS
jgi:hypothetical protein